jgi:transposase InsO family protein
MLYPFTTMPFGLCNAASTFERLIDKALRRLQWRVAVLYLDVLVVFGKTWEQHFDNLAQVLERLAEAGLKLKLNVTSDQGKQYESALFREMCKLLEINKTRTTPLHPRSDGMIERMIRIINDMLSKYIKSHQKDWDQCLDFITMAYNSTPHESTGISPYK